MLDKAVKDRQGRSAQLERKRECVHRLRVRIDLPPMATCPLPLLRDMVHTGLGSLPCWDAIACGQ